MYLIEHKKNACLALINWEWNYTPCLFLEAGPKLQNFSQLLLAEDIRLHADCSALKILHVKLFVAEDIRLHGFKTLYVEHFVGRKTAWL